MGKSWSDEIISEIKADIERSLRNEVLDEIRKVEVSNIEKDVFSEYSPEIYQRRGSGGIDDPDNTTGNVKGMRMKVENVTPFSEGYGTYNHGVGLAGLVNDGNKKSGYYYDYNGEFEKARPFWDDTAEMVEETDMAEDALAEGLRKRGYTVK